MKYWSILLVFPLVVSCSTFGLFSAKPKSPTTANTCQGADCGTTATPSPWQIYDEPVEVESTDVQFRSGADTLTGQVTRPKKVGKKLPAILFIHDLGPMGRDGIVKKTFGMELPVEVPIYRSMGEILAARGFVVMTFDKRTCIQGGPPWCTYSASMLDAAQADLGQALVDDAHAALSFLAARDDVQLEKLVVLGHGQGAEIALNLPPQPQIAALGLLGISAYAPDDVVLDQTERSIQMLEQALSSRASDAETDEMSRLKEELTAALKKQETDFAAVRKGEADQAMGLSSVVWASLFRVHEQAMEALKTSKKTLVVLGAEDADLPEDNEAALEPIIAANKGATLVELDINHALVSINDDPTVVSDEMVERIFEFLTSPDTAPAVP